MTYLDIFKKLEASIVQIGEKGLLGVRAATVGGSRELS